MHVKTPLIIVFFLFNLALINAQTLIEPGCDYFTNDSISLSYTLSGQEASDISFYLTDDNGEILQGPLPLPEFGILDAGGYLVYSATTDGVYGMESNINDLTSSNGCLALSNPYGIVVCYSKEITTNDSLSIHGVGGDTTNTNCYTLLTEADGVIDDVIQGVGADFGMLTDGEYFAYIFCTKDGDIPLLGNNVNSLNCGSCCDWSAPYSINITPCYPPTFIGPQEICIGDTTRLERVLNAVWQSSDENVAIISSSGVVTAVGAGTATFSYQISGTGCNSANSLTLTVNDRPTISINGPSKICEGAQTGLLSNSAGEWNSSDENIATISSSGIVSGISSGIATISFTSYLGCSADSTLSIEVVENPSTQLLGDSVICVGESTQLSPSSGGIWIASDYSIASVSSSGNIIGLQEGEAEFIFVESNFGCESLSPIGIRVNPLPTISNPDNQQICEGEITFITPSVGGIWTSSDESVATITNNGIITGIGSGVVNFIYSDSINSCTSEPSGSVLVNDLPVISSNGPTQLCEGQTSNLLPSEGGFWTSSDDMVAEINNHGEITAISAGVVDFVFTSTSTLCSSQVSEEFTVTAKDPANISGPDTICLGESILLIGSSPGSWSSSNNSIASITNSGLLTALSTGEVTINLTTTKDCVEDPSKVIFVNPSPNISIVGPNEICVGENTNLIPASGGTWSSSNESVAIINDEGVVTGQAAGLVKFTFTNNQTGCSRTTDSFLLVKEKPEITLSGNNTICVGSTTSFNPMGNGNWFSNNPSIATISTNGIVTGISPGTTTFTYFDQSSGCSSDASIPITVTLKPFVSISGDVSICIGENSTLSPNSGGTWVSNDETVATVTPEGLVTGVGNGVAYFTFTSDSGCSSNTTMPLIVFGPPSIVIDGDSYVCLGDSLQLLSNVNGSWSSTNELVGTINENGVVSSTGVGAVKFVFTDANTGCSSESAEIFVNPNPEIDLVGPNNICIGETTNLAPFNGGVWTSLDPMIATINNSGEVTGLTAGEVTFIYSNATTGCVSDTSEMITVQSIPDLEFLGPEQICLGDTTYLSPTMGGTWTSSNNNVATVNNTGMVIGQGQGEANFTFTSSSGQCMTVLESPLTVNDLPVLFISGSSYLCLLDTAQLNPSFGGVWESLQPSIASVNNNGIAVGLDEGDAEFIFTETNTGCTSEDTLNLSVLGNTVIGVSGDTEICVGYTTNLFPSTGGFWRSNNPLIASVTSSGFVKAKAAGKVTFTFTDAVTGCETSNNATELSIFHCKNPDFNVTLVNDDVIGNLSTNDNFPEAQQYSSNFELIERPSGSIYDLSINPDGTYIFNATKAGNYRFSVTICLSSGTINCSKSLLEITVLENLFSYSSPVSNLDISTVINSTDSSLSDQETVVRSLYNDKCVGIDECFLDSLNVTIIKSPSYGNVIIDTLGDLSYVPIVNYVGYDTIEYRVCINNGNCNSTVQILSINDISASNSVVAADDFGFTLQNQIITGNAILNDSDPENDNISILGQGSSLSPISISEGSYYIDENGNYAFTPNPEFNGTVDIVYTLCDDNANVACRNATIHILVLNSISLRLRMYLEGALMNNQNAFSSEGRPLMRDDLRNSPFTGKNYIPLQDPYSESNLLYVDLNEKYSHLGPHLLEKNQVIIDSFGVFSVTGENAIVDWVHVELRSKDNMVEPIASRAGLLQRDGDIVDLDGVSPLSFQGVFIDSFYVVAKHRSHLGVMSEKIRYSDFIDFTSLEFPVYNFGNSIFSDVDYTGLSTNNYVKNGYRACWAGDMDSDGRIKFVNPNDDLNVLFTEVLLTSPNFLANYNLALGYYMGDYDMNSKSKFTNPNDDQNYLLSQVILYPQNFFLITNFNHFIEQVPYKE